RSFERGFIEAPLGLPCSDDRRYFRARSSAASLKQVGVERSVAPVGDFRARSSAASLKRQYFFCRGSGVVRFPRSFERGFIEATPGDSCHPAPAAFPRSFERGFIEAPAAAS